MSVDPCFAPGRRRRALIRALALLGALVAPLDATAVCVGDCPPTDGQVAVHELITGVNIVLGSATLTVCPDYDADAGGTVDVSEMVVAVNNAQQGCSGAPTPSSTPGSPVPSATPTATGPTATPTTTSTPSLGPVIWFFGITAADDSPVEPTIDGEIPIYERMFGFSFSLVIEAARGESDRPVETETLRIGALPGVLVQATRPLGNGSGEVCDNHEPIFGGVPGIDPPKLESPDAIADALNDFGCRFIDGTGATRARPCTQACIRYDSGEFHCADEEHTEWQFCAPISAPLQFPDGDTLVTARAIDVEGTLGPPKQLIIRVTP